jgi:hypothetical protein
MSDTLLLLLLWAMCPKEVRVVHKQQPAEMP